MKIIFLILLSFLLVHCSVHRQVSVTATSPVNEKDTIAKYIFLKDNQYILELSKAKAIELGVSKSEYKKAVRVLRRGNRDMRKSLRRKDCVLHISDPQEDYKKYHNRK